MIECIPNLCNLKMEHLINPSPAGEKIIPINFSNLDFEDSSGVEISFKACKTPEDLCDWYAARCDQYPWELIPYLVIKTMFPKSKITAKKSSKGAITKRTGNFTLTFA